MRAGECVVAIAGMSLAEAPGVDRELVVEQKPSYRRFLFSIRPSYAPSCPSTLAACASPRQALHNVSQDPALWEQGAGPELPLAPYFADVMGDRKTVLAGVCVVGCMDV